MNLPSLKPVVGYRRGRGQDRLLMVCYYDPNGIPTIYENIANWQEFSRYQIEVLNLWPTRPGAYLHLPATLDLTPYAGIVIHCTGSYSPLNLFALDQQLETPFEEFDGLKILMKQDEQVQTSRFGEFIAKKKFDIVITCLPPEEVEKVYPRDVVGDIDFIHAYTGYVSPALRSLRRQAISERSITISYRGSIQPLEFGRLGYEKRGVGYDIAAAAQNVPSLRVDISSRWEDRIGGNAWFDFLGQSKVVLGAESGSNLFDFSGEVASWCRTFEASNADLDPYSKSFYLKAHDEFLHRFEDNVNYAQISPRHFEAAVCQAAQILYEGEYSGIFKPHRHFFPLKRDLSNIAEALDFARDDRRLKEFSDCAYEEVIGNPDYHYERFVETFDSAVERRMQRKQSCRNHSRVEANQSASVPKALLLMAHEPTMDPRIDWFSEGLATDFEVCEVGVYHDFAEVTAPSVEQLSDRRTRVRVDGQNTLWNFATSGHEANGKSSIGTSALQELFLMSELPLRHLGMAIGALDATEDDLARFRWYCRYFLNRNSALLEASRRIGGFDLIVAVDLHSLPAAVALSEEYGVPLVYDAHEYWPYCLPEFRHWETEFWSSMERKLLKRVTLPLTVSPQLADLMSQQYGCAFGYVPNCTSLGTEKEIELEPSLAAHSQREDVIFLVQGAFAPHRGFDKLISAWDKVDPRAKLWLRGPENSFKTTMIDLAQRRSVLNRSVFFPEAVSASELVRSARDADIGLVPYEPNSPNNRYCSPNKLSQYMAAGLPIICNELDFVKSIVVGNGIGTSVDFSDEAALVRAINEQVLRRDSIPDLSRKSQEVFRTSFNWQSASQETYSSIKKIVSQNEHGKSRFDFAWIKGVDHWNSSREPSAHEIRIEGLNEDRERLIGEIQALSAAYTEHQVLMQSEVAKLNSVYSAEIERLNTVYSGEIERLKTVGAVRLLRRAARPLKAMARTVMGARGKQ